MRTTAHDGVWNRILTIALVAGAYIIAGKFGLNLASVNASASAVWAPTGIAIAAVLLRGPVAAAGIFIGAFVVNLTTAGTVATSLGIGMGNTLEAVAAAWLTRRFAAWPRTFDTFGSFWKFVLLAAFVATMLSPTVGVTTLAIAGFASWAQYASIWFTWWVGDVAGAIVIAPLILLWSVKQSPFFQRPGRPWEAAALALFSGLSLLVAFGEVLTPGVRNYPVAFVCIPSIIWVGYRFGPRATASLSTILSIVAIAATLYGYGPFGAVRTGDPLVFLQGFLGVMTLTGLSLTTATMERHRATDKLHRSEKLYRTLFEHSFDGVVLLSEHGTILYAAPSVTRILEYPLRQFVGMNTFSFVHADDQLALRSALARILREPGASIQMEYRFRYHDGGWRWLEATWTNLLGLHDVQAIVCNFRDINDRKRESIVQSKFVSLASHQLRTPLTVIRWALEDLRTSGAGALNEWHRENMETAARAAKRMADAIRSMLVLSQLQGGTIRPDITEMPLGEILREMEREYAPECRKKSQTLQIATPSSVRVKTDMHIVQQILGNLLNNAILYSPVASTIAVESAMQNGFVRICVTDQGPGIPVPQRDRVFSLFFRGVNAQQGGHEGAGLGLYVAHAFAEALGGNLTFETSDKGTTFILSLPLQARALSSAAAATMPAATPARA